MARRRKTSAAEDWTDLVAMLPWWAGVALALLFYSILHRIASQPVAAAVQPGQMGAMVVQAMWKALAGFGQYLLPLICLVGAGTSAWRRRERRALLTNVVQSKAADVLDNMTWQQFEHLVGEAFRLQGYSVLETGGGGGGRSQGGDFDRPAGDGGGSGGERAARPAQRPAAQKPAAAAKQATGFDDMDDDIPF